MAKNRKAQDDAAAKAKKQKIILVVGGVLLLGVAAIQVPKLMKHSGPPAQKAAAETTSPSPAAPSVPAATAPTGTVTAVKVSGPRATAILAGVTIQGSGTPAADEGQLSSFSLFDPKDPFVPQASAAAPAAATPAPAAKPATTPADATGSTGGAGAGTAAVTAAPPPTNATITMNGAAHALVVKQPFPKGDPLFVLVSLKPKLAKIGVAGGSFADGKTLALPKGKPVTLVNDATGARYTLELVYTGTVPEQTESFTQATK